MMKKFNFMVGALLAAISLTACSGASQNTVAAEDNANVTEKTSETVDETTEKTSEAVDEKSYKEIYTKLVENLSSSEQADMFSLIYVDEDDIPELAAVSLEGSWEKDQVFLYTTDGKEAVLLASDIAPGMEGHYIAYFEKKDVFMKSGAPMGDGYVFYKIENSKPVQTLSANYSEMIDADGNDVAEFAIDDAEASEEEYISALKNAIPDGSMIKLAENDNMDLIKYDVNLDEGYMELSETETFPYRSSEDILEDLK